jgi:hypothetical protein
MTKKAKIQPKPPLDVEWKATIEAKVNSLMVGMAKMDSLVEPMVEIKAMLASRQHQ